MPHLHVFTGDHAAGTVREALRIGAGDFLVQHDVISCGPLADYRSRAEWTKARLGFWMSLDRPPQEWDKSQFPNDLVEEAERLAKADRITLWVGAGLSDRLLLPAVIHLADIEGFSLPPVEVAEIVSHKSLSAPVVGWGMLRPTDVGRPKTRQLGPADFETARRVWATVTSDDPRGLVAFLDSAEDEAQVNAMSTLIYRYPDVASGVSHWDGSLLNALPDAGSGAFEVVGGAIGANFHHLDPVGDMYLFWRLRRMAKGREPLVTLSGDKHDIRACRVVPTALGTAVRNGKANAIARNGIDDWVGGVHLRSPAGSPWYRRNGGLFHESEI